MRIEDYLTLNNKLLASVLNGGNVFDDKNSAKEQGHLASGAEKDGKKAGGQWAPGPTKGPQVDKDHNLTVEQGEYYEKNLKNKLRDKVRYLSNIRENDDGSQPSTEILNELESQDEIRYFYPWEQLLERNMANYILTQSKMKPEYDMSGVPDIEVSVFPNHAGGVEQGKRMTHTEAASGKVNPNFSKNDGYDRNCATCVLTYLLRRKGFDVTAKAMKEGSKTDQLSIDPFSAYLKAVKDKDRYGKETTVYSSCDQETIEIPYNEIKKEKTIEFINEQTKDDPDGAIYLIHLEPNDKSDSGHDLAARKENGHITVFDVQGDAETQKKLEKLWPNDEAHNRHMAKKGGEGSRFLRIDDKIINPHYIIGENAVVEPTQKAVKPKEVSPKHFAQALLDAKASMPENQRWKVSSYDADHYKETGAKTYNLGGSTVAVTKDGDIVSVCTNKDGGAHGYELLEFAVKHGGVKLDSFDGNYRFYTNNGFEPVSWTKFNEEYAPEGWNKKYGAQDIVFFKYVGKGNVSPEFMGAKGMRNFYNTVDVTEDYDEAMQKRDNSIAG